MVSHPYRQLLAMCAAHVEAVKALVVPLCGAIEVRADPAVVARTTANLALSLAVVAECGPATVATSAELHGLFFQLVGLLPSVSWLSTKLTVLRREVAVHSDVHAPLAGTEHELVYPNTGCAGRASSW